MPVSKGESIDLERTRGKVLKAATELFYRDGHPRRDQRAHRTRRGSPSSRCTATSAARTGLLEEVLRQRSDRVVDWLKAAADTPADPVERVLAVFDALRGWYAEQGFRGCAIVNAATESPSQATRDVARMHLGRHRELLTALARDTGTADPELDGPPAADPARGRDGGRRADRRPARGRRRPRRREDAARAGNLVVQRQVRPIRVMLSRSSAPSEKVRDAVAAGLGEGPGAVLDDEVRERR